MQVAIIKSNKTAIVLGATGLVGSHLVNQLLEHPAYAKVVTLTRRKNHQQHPKLENVVVDFDRLAAFAHYFKGDDVFICLGTTRAKAGSAAAFRKVDYDYVVESAKLAKAQGCQQCLLVSSAGADANSGMLYPKTKGEAEEAVQSLGFWATHLLQPSLLLGERAEFRLGEKIGKVFFKGIDFVAGNLLGAYRPIEGADVASAMIVLAQQINAGVFTHPSDELIKLAT